ncbi:MAG: cold-shock protein [Erysipelothrix sp.]|nr:cold-shock protein [Erysipelothrix sp.]
MQTGTVKFFNNTKGYGFITVDGEEAKEVFVHFSAINSDGYKSLSDGDRVEFELITEDRGEKAINVSLVEA